MIRIKRLETVSPRLIPRAFNFDTSVITGTPVNNGSSNVFVIACMDARYINALESYLLAQLTPGTTYDLFTLEGASYGGLLTSTYTCPIATTNWDQTLLDHIQVAISLHNISQIWIIDHINCKGYAACGQTDNQAGHLTNAGILATTIRTSSFYQNGTSFPTATRQWSAIFPTAGNGISSFYFTNPVGTSTTLTTYGGATIQTQYIPAQVPNTTKILILGCIDPRFSELLSSFLNDYKGIDYTYDLFILAGSSLGVNQTYNSDGTPRAGLTSGTAYPLNLLSGTSSVGPMGVNWGPTFFDHLKQAILNDGITEVWSFDHLDCGAYKAIKFGNFASTDLDPAQHIPELQKLQGYIQTRYPSISFKGFIMDTAGKVTKVVDDGLGVVIDTLPKNFGSSKVRAPVSDILDVHAKASADFVLKVEKKDTAPGIGFSNQLQVTKLTPTPSKTTILNPKVITTKHKF